MKESSPPLLLLLILAPIHHHLSQMGSSGGRLRATERVATALSSPNSSSHNRAHGLTVKQLPPTPGSAGAGATTRQVFQISGGAMELAVAQPTIQNVALLHRMALVQRRKLHEEVQVRIHLRMWIMQTS